MRELRVIGLLIGLFALMAGTIRGETLYVDASRPDDAGTGLSWATAKKTIQAAVNLAPTGATVLVTNGTYTLSSEILITNDIVLTSVNGPLETVVDGGGSNRCFNLSGTLAHVAGFTVTNGYTGQYDDGGGIFCGYGGKAVVSNCFITGNASGSAGGGMFFGIATDCRFVSNMAQDGGGASYTEVIDCVFEANEAEYFGGGVMNASIDACELIGNSAEGGGGSAYSDATNSVFRANAAGVRQGGVLFGDGGGMYGGTASDCLFIGNGAAAAGGGIASGTAIRCRFLNNAAQSGGGGAFTRVRNCMLIGNLGREGGGGLRGGSVVNSLITGNLSYESGGGMDRGTATNCTFTANHAMANGGGAYSNDMKNCIAWGNTADGNGKNLFNVTAIFSCSPDALHGIGGNITDDPGLVSAYHIEASSPCRGVGGAASAIGMDLDGQSWRNPPSMGCDEPDSAEASDLVAFTVDGPDLIAAGATGTYYAVVQGPIEACRIDFGDGQSVTNAVRSVFQKAWNMPGEYNFVIWARDANEPTGRSYTQAVSVVSKSGSAIHVDPVNGDDPSDGITWSTAKATIQAGVDAQGVYGGLVLLTSGVHTVTAEVVVAKDIEIAGAPGLEPAVVNGSGVSRCFLLMNCAAILSNLTLSNAYSDAEGGAVFCMDGTPVVRGCLFIDNQSYDGGGVRFGTMHRFSLSGYPVRCFGVAEDCRLERNRATYAAGVSSGTARSCLFLNNRAEESGGAMSYGTATACIFSNNTAVTQDGGGVSIGHADNSLFVGNIAMEGGGAAYVDAVNCTFIDNVASNTGGGLYRSEATNCIVFGNVALNSSNNLSLTTAQFTCSPDLQLGVGGNTTNLPTFRNAAGGDYRLAADSPCVDTGTNGYPDADTDLAGKPRIVDGAIDMGAYEYYGDYVIIATAGPNGSMAPSGAVSAVHAGSRSFTNAPDPYFHVDAVYTNGANAGSAITFAWTNIQADGQIDAIFGENILQGVPGSVPEWWVAQFGWGTNLNALAMGDQDVDRMLTWQEYVAGTRPDDTHSVFKVNKVEVTAGDKAAIAWAPSVAGRVYRIHGSTNFPTDMVPLATTAYPVSTFETNLNVDLTLLAVSVEHPAESSD